MTEIPKAAATADRRRQRIKRLHRVMRRTLYAKLGLAFALLIAAAIVYLRLVAGPVSLANYSDKVGEALASRIGPGWSVGFDEAALELDGVKPALRTAGLEIRNPGGVLVVRAPMALVSLDPVTLLGGNFALRALELRDLQLRLLVAQDGSLSFVPQDAQGVQRPEGAMPTAPAAPATPSASHGPSALSQAIASLLEPVLAPDGIVGALDRAVVTNARLTLIGADGRERVAFSRVGARFERAEEGRRRIALELDGPHGPWKVGGTAQDDAGTRSVDLNAAEVPMADILLLAGLSGLPDGSNLKLSAELSASLVGRGLTRLGGRFRSSSGVIELPDKDLRFLHVDEIAGSGAWDEDRRVLSLKDMSWRSGPTRITLDGELAPTGEPQGWSLAFSGKDAVFSGATEADQPVRIAGIAGRLAFAEGGVTLDGLSVRGEDVDASLTGAYAFDKRELRTQLEVRRTHVRRLIRLWPETVAVDLRRYLAGNAKSGMVEKLSLAGLLDETDLKNAFAGQPVSDKAVKLSFAVSDGSLAFADGIPPLAGLALEGVATGTSATLAARQGRVEAGGGRSLNFTEGSYRQAQIGSPDSIARIAFRLDGGADALAAAFRSARLREAVPFEPDPAAVKGRADLRVTIPLNLSRLPKNAAEASVSIGGTFSDLSVEKIYGREKLENANLTVALDASGLFIRGEGKVSGSPAAIDLHQPRGQAGELVLTVITDDAARTRRSLPSAPQLAGPVPVKILLPLGKAARAPTRIEADLGRAAIDNLLPGWTKPAGRPGRISFLLNEAEPTELRDVAVDAGPVQIRGHASLGPEGGVERADLATLKLSPGDDMHAQVERSNGIYKVVLRGNIGDARPMIKALTASPAAGQKGRGTSDLDADLDLALNIMTGHNEEALTGVTARASTRRSELRSLHFGGRFRRATVEAQLARRDPGPPVLIVQSGDAGATLRFLDLYKRMVGGTLTMNAAMGDAVQAGSIAIDAFALRNEPALRRIIAQQEAPSSEERSNRGGSSFDADQVHFTKLTADFQRSQSRIDYKDVVIWGSQIGFTLSGFVDHARDRTDISGTFVPAYGLNNAFSQVPIVGLLLGGGNRNEGLFAVDFRISGAASAPTLTVNPLSAMAPGILRKFFGWAMPDGDVPTGAVPQRSER
jgi:hypothetical protein